MLGPVVEVGRLREGSDPDDQADQGGGVEDQPGEGDRKHLGVVVLSVVQRTSKPIMTENIFNNM